MNSALSNFRNWYVKSLQLLFPVRDAGFPIALIAFPLLERYIRQRVGLSNNDNLNDAFFRVLTIVLPDLEDSDTARAFWSAYRNGLLHSVTLSRETRKGAALPVAWLSHDVPLFSTDKNGDHWLHPVLFAERVIAVIEGDFQTFENGHPTVNPLPSVHSTSLQTGTSTGMPGAAQILGTKSGP